MVSLVSMMPRAMMEKLHRNIEVKVAKKVFSSTNTLHLLYKSEFHCKQVVTMKLVFQTDHKHAIARISKEIKPGEGNCKGSTDNNCNGGRNRNDGDGDNYFHYLIDNGTQEGQFRRCDLVLENFNSNFMQTILQKSDTRICSLPSEIHQDIKMKIINSTQMVRFLSTYAQSIMARFFSRMPPEFVSRIFMGRILANHAFLYRLLVHNMVTIAFVLRKEFKYRKNMKEEWDIVVVNVLTTVVSTTYINWALAPIQSHNLIFKYGFRNALQELPNHISDKSFFLQKFGMAKRVLNFIYKVGELTLFGLVIEALASVIPLPKGMNMSAPMFSMNRRAWSYMVFLGLLGNLRYQVVFALERHLQDHLEHLQFVLFISALLRAFNVQIGDINYHSKTNYHSKINNHKH